MDSSDLAVGGKAVYGASIGILMLDTKFPRILGDVGHAGTWQFPVMYKVVKGATGDRVKAARKADGATELLDSFIKAGRELVSAGADGLTTSCGFLSIYQEELANSCQVPVVASSLMQIPMVERSLPAGQRVGVITISAELLSTENLMAAGAPADTPLVGLENRREFSRVQSKGSKQLNVVDASADVLDAAKELVDRHAGIGAIVLECTNIAPFASELHAQLGIPVYSLYNLVNWFHDGLTPRRFLRG